MFGFLEACGSIDGEATVLVVRARVDLVGDGKARTDLGNGMVLASASCQLRNSSISIVLGVSCFADPVVEWDDSHNSHGDQHPPSAPAHVMQPARGNRYAGQHDR